MCTEEAKKIEKAAEFILSVTDKIPPVAVTLGSGLGKFAESLTGTSDIRYEDIPYYPVSTVAGHKGRLVMGKAEECPLVALQGRAHYYEGYSLSEITFPIRLLYRLGVRYLILTNASGSLNPDFQPGDFMLIADYINFTGLELPVQNKKQNGSLFSEKLNRKIGKAADAAGISLHRGTYTWTIGPSYETPAEIRLIAHIGGDAVGMSTVPEAVQASALGMEVAGISCLTNWAAGISGTPLNHEEVTETAKRVEKNYMLLMNAIIREIYTDISGR